MDSVTIKQAEGNLGDAAHHRLHFPAPGMGSEKLLHADHEKVKTFTTVCTPALQYAFGPKRGLWFIVPFQLIVMVGLAIVYCVTGGESIFLVIGAQKGRFESKICKRTNACICGKGE